jgi:hypothetical protein
VREREKRRKEKKKKEKRCKQKKEMVLDILEQGLAQI